MTTRRISKLYVHPLNIKIYGAMTEDALFDEIVESVKKHGVITPLVITPEGMIISGHRRFFACRKSGVEDVPVFVKEFRTELDAEEALIEANRQREKTTEQKAREFGRLKEIEAERAKLRQAHGNTAPGKTLVENFPQALESGKARDAAANKVGFGNSRTAEKAADVVSIIDEAEAMGDTARADEVRTALNRSVNGAYKNVEPAVKERKEAAKELKGAKNEVVDLGNGLYEVRSLNPNYRPSMNAVNDNIEWAKWSWNPVTGCLHDCRYCYARAMAENSYYGDAFPMGFKPAFHPGRLSAPANTKIPEGRRSEAGIGNVFVCSMADLFGDWVPVEWIQAVLDSCRKSPEFNFLFLTKNPKRYAEFQFPRNSWIGATADTKARGREAIEAFSRIEGVTKFLSCEPLSEELDISDDEGRKVVDWVIIGALKNSENSPRQPQWAWVESLVFDARVMGAKIYFKPNLTVRPMEYPAIGKEE